MSSRLVALAVVLMMSVSVACKRDDPKISASASRSADDAAVGTSTPLPAGAFALSKTITFDIPVVVNKDHRRVINKRRAAREVLLEYLSGDTALIDDKIESGFSAAGFVKHDEVREGNALYSVYRKQGAPDIRVWVQARLPEDRVLVFKRVDAKGTIRFKYRYSRSR